MFKQLLLIILTSAGLTQYKAGKMLGYKTPSSFQSVTQGQDIRLSVLINICTLAGFDVLITNNKGITINVQDYINEQASKQTPAPAPAPAPEQ